MRSRALGTMGVMAFALAAAASPARAETNEELRDQVRKAETAFARTMADRDHAAFVRFLADDTIWLGRTVLRGKQQVADAWKGYYEGKEAPFSWEPERVEVNDAGTLGISVGPVRDPAGKRVGTYNSIWRRGRTAGRSSSTPAVLPAIPRPRPAPRPPRPELKARSAARSVLDTPQRLPSNGLPLVGIMPTFSSSPRLTEATQPVELPSRIGKYRS